MYDTIIPLVREAALKYGDKCAYREPDRELSFKQLWDISLKISARIYGEMKGLYDRDNLRQPVIFMLSRNVLTPGAYIGAALTGCFYAPCEAALPVSRLDHILELCQGRLMIVDKMTLQKAKECSFDGKILLLEDILMDAESVPYPENCLACEPDICGTDPIYMIFTSGSTGKPKGVLSSHDALLAYLDGLNEVLGVDEGDILGNQSPLDYIAAIRDIYLPLLTGASTYIIPSNEFAMPAMLFDTIAREGITTLCWSASGLEMAVRMGLPDSVPDIPVKKVIFSGSVISGKYLAIWQELLPEATFINQYGPTEATASCTYYVVKEKADENTRLPIGRPYRHYDVFLMSTEDESGKRIIRTPGEAGEICVSGRGISLGYYRDPERSAASFIQNPMNDRYRELIYLTGDLGRYDENGELEFLGRKDRQIKHLGHRIELDEIEVSALGHVGVSECCALYLEDKELLCLLYSGSAEARDISIYFRNIMPPYMVPRRIVKMEKLPHLPNGKKDIPSMNNMLK